MDEDDIMLWEHDFFPSFRVSRLTIGTGEDSVVIKVGDICKLQDLHYFVCEIEARPKNRKYVLHTHKFARIYPYFRYTAFGILGTQDGKGNWKWDEDGVTPIAATKAQEVLGEASDKDWSTLKKILQRDNAQLVYVQISRVFVHV